jgi:branched-subunit amino acid aminotransferase/4-amino-4-deoxychorismate lyase
VRPDPRRSRLPAWAGDDLVDPTLPAISPLDAGLRSGIGVFETFRAHGNETLALDRHLDRLAAGAERLGIRVVRARIAEAIDRTLAAPRELDEVAVRVTVTAGPVDVDTWPPVPGELSTLLITLHPAPQLPLPAVSAITVEARRWPADVKTTSYLASVLAQRTAIAAGVDVAVLVDGDELLETAEGNLVAIVDGGLVTPPADGRLLAGVTRDLVLEEGRRRGLEVGLRPLRRDDVAEAEALFVTSAVSGIRSVRTLDGQSVRGSGAGDDPHPLLAALRDALMLGHA